MENQNLSLTSSEVPCAVEKIDGRTLFQNNICGESKLERLKDRNKRTEGKHYPFSLKSKLQDEGKHSPFKAYEGDIVHVRTRNVAPLHDQKWLDKCRKIDLGERQVKKCNLIDKLHKLSLEDWKRDEEMSKLRSLRETDTKFIVPKTRPLPPAKSNTFSVSYSRCFHCQNIFYDDDEYNDHMRIYRRDGKCKVPEVVSLETETQLSDLRPSILKPADLVQNMATAGTTKNKCSCHICYRQFPHKRLLLVHVVLHYKENTYFPLNNSSFSPRCSKICKKTKEGISQVCSECKMPLKRLTCCHYFKDPLRKSYVCAFCNNKYKVKLCVQRHVIRHLKIKENATEIYNHIFRNKKNETNKFKELLSEDAKRPFICQVCREGFFEEHLLSQHNEMHIKSEQEENDISNLAEMLSLA